MVRYGKIWWDCRVRDSQWSTFHTTLLNLHVCVWRNGRMIATSNKKRLSKSQSRATCAARHCPKFVSGCCCPQEEGMPMALKKISQRVYWRVFSIHCMNYSANMWIIAVPFVCKFWADIHHPFPSLSQFGHKKTKWCCSLLPLKDCSVFLHYFLDSAVVLPVARGGCGLQGLDSIRV